MIRLFLPVLAFSLVASIPADCRADFITPNSISRPAPGNVASADGSPIASFADLVTDQYLGHGLRFGPEACVIPCPTTAITKIAGVEVWVPALETLMKRGQVGELNYFRSIYVSLTAPTDYLAVEVIGLSGPLTAFDDRDHQIGFAFVSDKVGPNGGKVLEIIGEGIERFEMHGPLLFDFPTGTNPQWGIAGIATTPVLDPPILPIAPAPEPASLLLALLGAVGVAGPAVRSRLKRTSVR